MIYNSETGELILEFDTYTISNVRNNSNVAFEVLEAGAFSSDSKQNTPNYLRLQVYKSIPPQNAKRSTESVIAVREQLKELSRSTQLVNVVLNPQKRLIEKSNTSRWWEYGELLKNYNMILLNYENTPDQLELVADIELQEIRMTSVEYGQTQIVANPENTPTVPNGQVQPEAYNSVLFNNFGQIN